MMHTTFRDIIELWATPDKLAEEIGASVWAARKWKFRDSIPPEWWGDVAAAARKRDKSINLSTLAKIAASRRLSDRVAS